MLLQNINPDAIKYSFNWGNKDRSDLTDKVTRAEKMQSLGYSFETVHNEIGLSKVTFEEELERIKKQVELGVIPYGISMIANAAVFQALMGKQLSSSEKIEQLIAKLDELKSLAESQMVPGNDKVIAMKQTR